MVAIRGHIDQCIWWYFKCSSGPWQFSVQGISNSICFACTLTFNGYVHVFAQPPHEKLGILSFLWQGTFFFVFLFLFWTQLLQTSCDFHVASKGRRKASCRNTVDERMKLKHKLKVFLEWSLTEGQIELMNDSFRIDWTHPWCPLSPPLPCMSPRSPVWGQLQRVTSAQEKVSGWGLAEQEQVHVVFCKTNSSANICLGSSSAMPVPYFTRDQQSHEKRKFWMLSWALQ